MSSKILDLFFKVVKKNLSNYLKDDKKSPINDHDKWRPCPVGEHWVKDHTRKSVDGNLHNVEGHCRKNKNGKDILKGDEIEYISQSYLFKNPKLKITDVDLGFKNENKYNDLIEGWTYYWNEIYKVTPPLHPNDIKILIASESGFREDAQAKNSLTGVGHAQGIIQITEQTQKILSGEIKELEDHFVILTEDEIWDANKNICAAIRWIFRQREIAKSKLNREPNWEEVIYEYKGIQNDSSKKALGIKKNIKELMKKISIKNAVIFFVALNIFENILANDFKFLKQSKSEVYIELLSNKVNVYCTKENPDKLSFTSLDMEIENVVYDFIFRRPWQLETCLWHKNKINSILKTNKIVRILGSQPSTSVSEKTEYDIDGKLYRNGKTVTLIFEKIDNGKDQCHAYFQSLLCSNSKNKQ